MLPECSAASIAVSPVHLYDRYPMRKSYLSEVIWKSQMTKAPVRRLEAASAVMGLVVQDSDW